MPVVREGLAGAAGERRMGRDGSITVADYWRAGVRGAPGTVKRVDERVRLHVLPHLGSLQLRDVTATVLRGYIATLEGGCAPRYARQILTSLSNIFETAIDDKRLLRNPMRAKSVRWPKMPEDQREAWDAGCDRERSWGSRRVTSSWLPIACSARPPRSSCRGAGGSRSGRSGRSHSP
ncbi:hypothetical protein AB0H77_25675 [Streptomyces sp. NPDC050844]|uniref:phage integrase central domain-containing protein n=1 Tax=Streptomyces sp. NPDC050844 TaxID=3155790 RepID=UPI0033D2023B